MAVVDYTPSYHELGYTFGGRTPVRRVEPGTVLRVGTEDCFGGRVRSVDDLPSRVCRFPYLNPLTGPFHIVGAEPGDTLAVRILDITPARDHGFSATFPHFGALTATAGTSLQPALPERVWRYDIDADTDTVRFQARGGAHTVDLPLEPMIGTIGVAPAGGEVHASITAGVYGGNLDTPTIRPGATVYLPVNVPGALLCLGDGHALQGEGEACGVAVEIPTRTTLAVDVVKGVPTPRPRIETNLSIASVGLGRPLEDAYRSAHTDLVGWVTALTGLDTLDAYQLVSQAATAQIGNVCDPAYTIVAAIDTIHLPGSLDIYDGAHWRLDTTPPH